MISDILKERFKININKEAASLIERKAEIVHFASKDTVLVEGVKSDKLYLMIKGIVRGYYIDCDGNDITKCFAAENQFFGTECFLTGKESTFTIETLEDCTAVKIPYSLASEIIKTDEELDKLFKSLVLNEIVSLERQKKITAVMNAEEKYRNFCDVYSDIYDRINLKYIASYIGIRPASLSRIRKNMKLT